MQDLDLSFLKEWIGPFSWYSSHPLDIKRFNRSLKKTIDINVGKNITKEDIEAYILKEATVTFPDIEKYADKYSSKADDIITYLKDTADM